MNTQTQQNEKGFTIIEVVLVLAIAGLIFLMVFIALPALQRSQRDGARKQEVSKVLASITTYQGNNRGSSPTIDAGFAGYIDGTYSTTTGDITLGSGTTVTKGTTGYVGTLTDANPKAVTNDNIVFFVGSKCGNNAGEVAKGTSRQAAAVIKLENGNAYYCQTN